MRKEVYIAIGIAMLASASLIGCGYAFTASFTDQPTSSMGDWNTSYADGTGIGGTSTNYVSLVFHDPAAGAEVHPEFAFTGISQDLTSYGYITLTLDGTGSHGDYVFYASVADVDGSDVTSFTVVGTAVEVDNDGIWSGTINFELHGGSSEALSAAMGSGAKLTVTSYHLVEAEP